MKVKNSKLLKISTKKKVPYFSFLFFFFVLRLAQHSSDLVEVTMLQMTVSIRVSSNVDL